MTNFRFDIVDHPDQQKVSVVCRFYYLGRGRIFYTTASRRKDYRTPQFSLAIQAACKQWAEALQNW